MCVFFILNSSLTTLVIAIVSKLYPVRKYVIVYHFAE